MSDDCQRPGCPGHYRAAGGAEAYCDTCGLPPVVSAAGVLGANPTSLSVRHRPAAPPAADPASAAASSGASSAASAPSRSRSRASHRSVPGRLPGTGRPPAAAVRASARTRAGSGSSARSRLGAGLVAVPPVPRPDPVAAVLARPEVPERKRFCGNGECGAPVGRSRGGRPGRTEGYCTQCGQPYSFVPKLRPGDVVRDQYRVAGCLAHGGLGWIYLATDLAVSNRWVVLKGLLDTGDRDAMEAAISERRFLAEIEHPGIVRIYNFVEHPDPRTGSVDGYIVMEYVGGRSLKDIANARRGPDGRRDPLPVAQACAFGIEALDALGHLHDRRLLYCDFKVDNAIQQEDRLKLIDMGAVRRVDDQHSAVYGTVGYQAPEVVEVGPSVASDLYTVARTLAVLSFDFQGYTTVYAESLPSPANIPVLRRYESFYRFLVRATDPDPGARFASAEEMAEQLTGVLREVVALDTGQPQPALSRLFGPELRVVDRELMPRPRGAVSALGARAAAGPRRWPALRRGGTRRLPEPVAAPPVPVAPPDGPPPPPRTLAPDVAALALALPVPRVDPADPNAGFLAALPATAPVDVVAALRTAPADSPELRLRELRAYLEAGGEPALTRARTTLARLAREYPGDWRVVWYGGLTALVAGDLEGAADAFDAVYDAFPGEVAPKLALAVCAEALGQPDNAADFYELVWTTDPGHLSAAFGLARVLLAGGDRRRAVAVLEAVPETSAHRVAARVAAVRARLRERPPTPDLLPDLLAAGEEVALLRAAELEPALGEQLSCEVLGSALDWVLSGGPGPSEGHPDTTRHLLGTPLDETGVRLGLERSYRRLARLAATSGERIELVEAANRFRPRTWV
jgi:serine/threonine-protein kinase PknG